MNATRNQKDKHWSQIWSYLWNKAVSGKKKYVTIPIFVIASIAMFFPHFVDSAKRTYDLLASQIFPSTYLTRSEYDVCNEWVAVIWSYTNLHFAQEEYKMFKSNYSETRDATWNHDIYLVRSSKEKGVWNIIIDMEPGIGSEEGVKREILKLKTTMNKERKNKNLVGQWLLNVRFENYNIQDFKNIYGDIKNIPEGCIDTGAEEYFDKKFAS